MDLFVAKSLSAELLERFSQKSPEPVDSTISGSQSVDEGLSEYEGERERIHPTAAMLSRRDALLWPVFAAFNESMVLGFYTVEPPNKGHFGG